MPPLAEGTNSLGLNGNAIALVGLLAQQLSGQRCNGIRLSCSACRQQTCRLIAVAVPWQLCSTVMRGGAGGCVLLAAPTDLQAVQSLT